MKNRYWDQAIWFANTSYVQKKLQWKPQVDLKKGLEKTVNWYKKFYTGKFNISDLIENNIDYY